MNDDLVPLVIQCLDLTSLNADDNDDIITSLCKKAMTSVGNVAAVCVYPQFVALAKKLLTNTPIKIATVVNFPKGHTALKKVLLEIQAAIANGADEIDMVVPYESYIQGDDLSLIKQYVFEAKAACGDHVLKTILETGAFNDDDKIYRLACACIEAGSDFIKSSTGKVAVGATPTAIKQMLRAISDMKLKGHQAGLKVSGGVREARVAIDYFNLMKSACGTMPTKNNFRIGASKVLDELLCLEAMC